MRSKTSFFNKRLFLNDLKSQIPTLVLLFLGYFGMLFIPGMMEISKKVNPDFGTYDYNLTTKTMVLSDMTDWMTNPVLIGGFAILIAAVLFHYQYTRRSSYMLHSMPIRRITHFASHALAGLTVQLIFFLGTFIPMIILATPNTWLVEIVFLRLLEAVVEMLFFYALALFTVVVCGNIILSFATYGVLNALWLFINLFAAFMHTLLVHHPIASTARQGFRYMLFENLDGLFPAYFFMKKHDNIGVAIESPQLSFSGDFFGILWMLIPAAIFCVLAAVLYKNKSIERTGETVAFGWCRIVFRVLFTFCGGGVVMGSVFVMMSNRIVIEVGDNAGLTAFAIVLLIGGSILGFLIGEMLLQKSVHIFKGKKVPYLQGVIPLVLMMIYVCLLDFNIIGPSFKPDPDQVIHVQISGSDFDGTYGFDAEQAPEALQKIAQAHRELVEDPKLLDMADRVRHGEPGDYRSVQFQFVNKDGNWIFLDYAYDNDEDKKRLMDTFMPFVLDDSIMIQSTIGKDASSLKMDEAAFSNFGNSVDRAQGYSDKVSFGNYFWQKNAFFEKKEADAGATVEHETDGSDANMTGYDYTAVSGTTELASFPLRDVELNSKVLLKYVDYAALYRAILQDMSKGRIIPYRLEDAVTFDDARHDDVICQMDLSLHKSGNQIEEEGPSYTTNDRYLTICVTTECTETIAQLEKAGAIVRKAGA